MKHFPDQVKLSSTSQLKAFQEFSKNYLDILMEPLLSVWPVIFVLKLNESVALAPLKSAILPLLSTGAISLQYCHRLPDVFE